MGEIVPVRKTARAARPAPRLRRALHLLNEGGHGAAQILVGGGFFYHGLAGMDDGPVIASAEGFADLLERGLDELTRKVHGDLARHGNVRRAAMAGHVREADVEMLGDDLLNPVNGDSLRVRLFDNV